MKKKEYLRFKWSHDHIVHRSLVRVINDILGLVPFQIKYAVGKFIRRNRPPYLLVSPGSTVVQVGAPSDTLHSGRSRAAYFCLFSGNGGKVIVIEPDTESVDEYHKFTNKFSLNNLVFVPCAVWSEEKTLRVYINEKHPASNFIEGTKKIDPNFRSEFTVVEIQANTLDKILLEKKVNHVDLVSITTNGSEKEILSGMVNTISSGLNFIALAKTGDYVDLMSSIGYEMWSFDDRGNTFKQQQQLSAEELQTILWN